MLRSFAVIFCVCTVLGMCDTIALAEGRITVDPNAGVQRQEEIADTGKKISYVARRKAVRDVLAELSAATGVQLKAGMSSADWQVRDRKITIYAKDVTLASLMNSIARVLKFQWQKNEAGDRQVYRLYMDRRILLSEDAQSARDAQSLEDRQAERRGDFLNCVTSLATDPQAMARAADNPFLRYLMDSGIASHLEAFFQSVPEAAGAFASGGSLRVDGSTLSPSAQQAVISLIPPLWQHESFAENQRVTLPPDLRSLVPSTVIAINNGLEAMRGTSDSALTLGDVFLNVNGRTIGISLTNPDTKMAQVQGNLMLKCLECGYPPYSLSTDSGPTEELREAMAEDVRCIVPVEKPEEHPDDPLLEKTIEINPVVEKETDLLSILAESSGLCVVADELRRASEGHKLVGQKIKLAELLDKIATERGSNWQLHGHSVEFRDREWLRLRAAQVPDEWLVRWKNKLEESGTLDIDDLSQMSMLSYDQYETNVVAGDLISQSDALLMVYCRDLLRVYAGLSAGQRHQLLTSPGLSLDALSQDQWQDVARLLSKRVASDLRSPGNGLRLLGKKDPDNKRFNYRFVLQNATGKTLCEWKFSTPGPVESKPPVQKHEQITGSQN